MKYAKFFKLLPFLMIFFIKSLMNSVKIRMMNFREMLCEHGKQGLANCFLEVGLDK